MHQCLKKKTLSHSGHYIGPNCSTPTPSICDDKILSVPSRCKIVTGSVLFFFLATAKLSKFNVAMYLRYDLVGLFKNYYIIHLNRIILHIDKTIPSDA